MMKRYSVYYRSNRKRCNSYKHFGGNSSTIKTAKSYIGRIKKEEAEDNPRDFEIVDVYAGMDNDIVPPVVYRE